MSKLDASTSVFGICTTSAAHLAEDASAVELVQRKLFACAGVCSCSCLAYR